MCGVAGAESVERGERGQRGDGNGLSRGTRDGLDLL